jgi:hypothetical protein
MTAGVVTPSERPLSESERTPPPARASSGPLALWALGATMALSAAVLLYAGRRLGFFYDEWSFVIGRYQSGVSTFLDPHNEHLSLIPVAVYKVLFATVGLHPYWVYRAVLVAVHLSIAGLLFALARRRIGDAPAVVVTVLVLFLGKAWEDLLWPFQIGYLASIAGGLGSLLALERGDRSGDVVAGALLGVALASSSLGIPLAAGIAAEIAWTRRWRRLGVVVVPLALYGLWYLGYGVSDLKADNIIPAADFALDAAAGAMGALAGQGLEWGRPLLVGALALLGLHLASRRVVTARLVGVLVAAASFWWLTGVARNGVAAPDAPRYLYPGAVLIVLAGCELARGAVPAPRQLGVMAAIAALAVALGASDLRAGARMLRSTSDIVRAELGAVDLLGSGRIDPAYQIDAKLAPQLTARSYLAAEAAIGGTAGYTPAQLPSAGGDARGQADRVLIDAGAARLAPTTTAPVTAPPVVEAGRPVTRRSACLVFRASGTAVDLGLRRGTGVRIRAGAAPVQVQVRRFLEAFQASPIGAVPAHAQRVLVPSVDRSGAPWHVRLLTTAAVTVCGIGGAR